MNDFYWKLRKVILFLPVSEIFPGGQKALQSLAEVDPRYRVQCSCGHFSQPILA